ncbi:MAG: 2,3-bisphosphoglycerate-independent phosphoglycerate mutase [Spirochaetales bacterium]|jgi:2,3-bisphosphoglycerate-independent phosphoglycerate mutase|nr:2,3-bisphosphoglycerate-independent phosphoglycerate mutase [Spirochaetales bacterium]
MVEALKKNPKFQGRRGPVVLAILDGVGYGKYKEGDAVAEAKMLTFDKLRSICPHTRLKAHGSAVGLPSDEDMGNSEVGHNAMGCGRVFAQGAKLVSASIAEGAMFAGETWKRLVGGVKASGGSLHFIGLFSDGNVHSHIDHLKAMLGQAAAEGVGKARVHILLDGRDVGETSALEYIDPFEDFLAGMNRRGVDYRIASGGGRQVITMDRYGANWDMVRLGWEIHVQGRGRQFASAREAVQTLRAETGAIDQDLPPFVIAVDGKPVGPVIDGDSVIYFNFRGDRALEITAAFEQEDFDKFDRGRRPKAGYAGMMEYDGDLHIPRQYLVSPPSIDRTLGEYLVASGVRQLAISETQKYGHVTYFFNGNRLGRYSEELEDYVEIKSDVVPFEQRPWMKCAEITDKVLAAIGGGKYGMIRLNFPNGDMVGHTGIYQAVICGLEGVDLCLGRIMQAVRKAGGVLIITADHGNSDDMFEHDKKSGRVLTKEDGSPRAKTAHSLNPVPCIIYDPESKGEYSKTLKEGLGISSLAATSMELLGFIPPGDYDPSVLEFS